MGTKQIRISERLYERVKDEKRGDETIGESLERIVGECDLLDFAADAEACEFLDIERIVTEWIDASERNAAELREDLDVE